MLLTVGNGEQVALKEEHGDEVLDLSELDHNAEYEVTSVGNKAKSVLCGTALSGRKQALRKKRIHQSKG